MLAPSEGWAIEMRINYRINTLVLFMGLAAILFNALGDSILSKLFVGGVLGYFLANSFQKKIS